MSTTNNIQDDLALYRQLVAKKREISTEVHPIKMRIFDYVQAHGDIKDEEGFAEKRTKPEQCQIKNPQTLRFIARIWAKSDDPILKSCGKIVLGHVEVTKNIEFVAIK